MFKMRLLLIKSRNVNSSEIGGKGGMAKLMGNQVADRWIIIINLQNPQTNCNQVILYLII